MALKAHISRNRSDVISWPQLVSADVCVPTEIITLIAKNKITKQQM